MSLKKKAIHGFAWTFGEQVSVQLVGFVIQMFLARLLKPAEYGLIAMLSVFITVSQALMIGGMTSSLIRTKDANQRDYSTVFYFNFAFSIVLYVILFFCAPLVSNFYGQEALTDILRVYSTTIVIQSLVAVQTTILTKEMNFKLQMKMRLPSVIIGGIVGIVLAYQGKGVWALVWMSIINAVIWVLQHWLFSNWKPSLIFDKDRFKYHFGYGYKLSVSSIVGALFDNIYNIVIGRWFSAADLGFYNRAYTTRQLPLSNISIAMNKVTFPLFAEIKDDDVRLKSVYKKLMIMVLFVTVGMLALMSLTAEPLIPMLYSAQWAPAAPYLQILCLAGIFYPLHSYNLNILEVKGRSDLFLLLEIVKRSIVVISVIVALQFGIKGLLYNQILVTIMAFFINTLFSGKMINYRLAEQLKDIAPVLVCGTLSYLVTWALRNLILQNIHVSNLIDLTLTCVIFSIVYLSLALLLRVPLKEYVTFIIKRK